VHPFGRPLRDKTLPEYLDVEPWPFAALFE
jgi:hypothetical protein